MATLIESTKYSLKTNIRLETHPTKNLFEAHPTKGLFEAHPTKSLFEAHPTKVLFEAHPTYRHQSELGETSQ